MFVYILLAIIVIACLTIKFFYDIKSRNEELKKQKEEERLAFQSRIRDCQESVRKTLPDIVSYLNDALLDADHYFTFSEMTNLKTDTKELFDQLTFLKKNAALDTVDEDASKLLDSLQRIEIVRESHNTKFVQKEKEDKKDFFDNALDYPLDDQQRNSIVKLEDNCLVVSSAGSGKTSTMIGKLLYLVRQREVDPNRILTITYTHKASEELTQRLLGTGLSCMTFHKLAMNIVAKVEGNKPSIADNGLFMQIFYAQLEKEKFRQSVLCYLTDHKSQVLNEHDYDDAVQYYRDRKKYGVVALYTDKDDRLITTKSEEEKKICSYLTELGVDFKYEQPYEYDTLTEDYRQYKPDFTIYYKNKQGENRRLYLEHYALNAAGQVPRWFGKGKTDGWNSANQRYLEGVEWKKKLHREHGTVLIYTTSADFHNGTIRQRLRTLLTSAGVPIDEPTSDQLLDRIVSRSKSVENALLQMTQGFINLVKANGKTIDDVRNVALGQNSMRDVFVIENIMKPLWESYHDELEKRREMDFTDVIVKATKYCNEGKWDQRYEYILVDEFQDISVDRYQFLLSLRTDLPKTKLFCVGDDWQSIYRFSGSDLSLFSEFEKYFGFTEECKIETTYRFGNPLIDESSTFVVKNPIQKKKNVHPRSVNPPETKISFMSYKNNEELQSLMTRMIQRVPADKTAYIISRYSHDVRALSSPSICVNYDANSDNVALNIAGRKVKFMTIHASKGLEADYVFLLNCNSGLYGFPSLVSDDPVLDYVLSDPEHFEYAEERRVFYVGITRAKIHTVVLYNEDTPSPFVSELNKLLIVNPDPCPWCGTGRRVLKYEGWTKQKTPYKVWGCDNREANCQYFEREFANHQYMHMTGRKFASNQGNNNHHR